MRTTRTRSWMRAALPAAAVAAALVLTGCNDDEESSESAPSESAEQEQQEEQAGQEDGQDGSDDGDAEAGGTGEPKPDDLSQIDASDLPEGVSPQDLVDLIPDGLLDLIPWEELEELLPDTDDRTPATVEELQGSWYTGPDNSDAFLSFTGEDVLFFEDLGAEGDICYGTASEGELTFDSCNVWGVEEWTAMSATLEFEGPTLVVTWEDGLEQEYYNDSVTSYL